MDNLLQELTNILCTVYYPSHIILYPMRQLGIRGVRITKSQRKKELDTSDKENIKHLLNRIMAIDIHPNDTDRVYYRKLLYQSMNDLITY